MPFVHWSERKKGNATNHRLAIRKGEEGGGKKKKNEEDEKERFVELGEKTG